MEPHISLAAWMDEKGYSNSELAHELDLGYDIIYKMANNKRYLTDGFKWRFAMRFGLEESSRIFDVPPSTPS
jgi:transposase